MINDEEENSLKQKSQKGFGAKELWKAVAVAPKADIFSLNGKAV